MNESELREGLREALTTGERPPPLRADAVLDAARNVQRRRRTTLAGVGAVVAVVAITVGGTVALSGDRQAEVDPAGRSQPGVGQPAPTPPDTSPVAPSPTGDTAGSDGTTPMPTGPDGVPQQDRTAQYGPRFDQGARLLSELVGVVPAGYTVPEDNPLMSTPAGPDERISPDQDMWAHYNQSQFSERVGDVEVWEHLASLAVFGKGGTGRLFVEVHTAGNTLPADTCGMATKLWGLGGDCRVVSADGKEVGLVTNTGDRREFDGWAAYRHADGTVVFVAQSTTYRDTGGSPLPQPIFTDEQLAALAADDRFRRVVTE